MSSGAVELSKEQIEKAWEAWQIEYATALQVHTPEPEARVQRLETIAAVMPGKPKETT